MALSDEDGPAFTLGDRLGKSLRASGISISEMAELLGVTRQTVGNWIADRSMPTFDVATLWAAQTGVPLGWLAAGVRRQGLEPRTRWLMPSTALSGGFTPDLVRAA